MGGVQQCSENKMSVCYYGGVYEAASLRSHSLTLICFIPQPVSFATNSKSEHSISSMADFYVYRSSFNIQLPISTLLMEIKSNTY